MGSRFLLEFRSIRSHPRGQDRRGVLDHRLPGISPVAAHVESAFTLHASVKPIAARTVSHAAEKRVRIGRMVQQHPGHPGIFPFQSLSRHAPGLATVIAEQNASMWVNFFPAPNARRTLAAALNHARRIARHEVPLMGITVQLSVAPGHAVLHAPPMLAAIVAPIKTARRRYIVALFTARIIFDV